MLGEILIDFISTIGLVVKSDVANVGPRVRFTDGAHSFLFQPIP
jgi:hypothetical protein